MAAEVRRLKWKARALDEDVLLAIQREVCSVQPEP
jgi:7,8-dihydro-6-hydroxymethylpterin-pyrophosphokinase